MDWKKLGRKLLFPPVWLMLILSVVSAAALIAVFLKGWEQTVAAYGIYMLAFYTLCTVTCFFVMVLPKQYSQIKRKIYENPFGNRYMTDKAFRTEVSLYVSLAMNLLYVGINVWFWYSLRSRWFLILAVYYTIMSIMRFFLLRYVRIHNLGSSMVAEWKRTRVCACILLLVNLSLSGAVLMILFRNRGYDYPGMMIYVMALYTFYSTIHAVVDILKYRSAQSPVMSTARIVSLSAALVSMLNLETAMFARFGADMAQQDQNLMIILTGAGISVIIVTLSVILIVKATREIRRETYGK